MLGDQAEVGVLLWVCTQFCMSSTQAFVTAAGPFSQHRDFFGAAAVAVTSSIRHFSGAPRRRCHCRLPIEQMPAILYLFIAVLFACKISGFREGVLIYWDSFLDYNLNRSSYRNIVPPWGGKCSHHGRTILCWGLIHFLT